MSQFFTASAARLTRLAAPLLGVLLAMAGTTQAQTLTLAGTGSASNAANDVSAFVDKVEIVRVPDGVVMPNALGNASFETPVQSGQGYSYNPTGASWNFVGSAGVTNNNVIWTPPTPIPAGSQLGFLQQTGAVTQALTLPAGTYQVRFAAAQRICCGAGGGAGAKDQSVKVTVGNMQVGTFFPTSTAAYTTFTSTPFTVNNVTNNALAFDGTNDYVSVPASLTTGVTNFTFEAWLNYQNNGLWTRVFDFGTGAAVNMFLTLRNDQTFAPRFAIKNGGTEQQVTSPTVLAAGWHHLAVTLSKAGSVVTGTLYVDGTAVATNTGMTLSPSDLGALTQLYLGKSQYAADPYLKGSLDEVRVYNAALTTAQVQADMFSTSSALPGSQLAYYNFDQGTAGGTNTGLTTLPDQSGNSRSGTLTNFALTGTTSNWVRSFPTITGIAPTNGPAGTSVTLSGTNLTDATGFAFNGTATTGFTTPTSDYTATVTVPVGATTGPVSVSSALLAKYNGPTFTVNGANNALAIDGGANYVEVTNTQAGVSNLQAGYTIETWVYLNSVSSGVQSVIRKDGDYNLYIFNGVLKTQIWSPSTTLREGIANVSLVAGRWYHVAGTWDGNILQVYVNGVNVTGTFNTATFASYTLPLRLGRSSVFNEPLNGRLDETRIYNTPLTAAQIQADMFSTTSAVPASLQAYYSFDQGVAGGTNTGVTSLTDQSGKGNTGTLNNFALTGTTSNWVRSFPTITGIAPTSGPVGTGVTLTGTNLTDATGFAFNGTATTGFTTPTNDYTATTSVPAGATTGPVSVTAATLTKYNGPSFTVTTPTPNNALAFDGVDDFVQTTPTPAPQLGSGSLTMEAWVRTTNTSGAGLTAIGADGGNFNEYWLGMYLNKAVIFMGGGVSCASTTSISDGKWHHIAGIRSGANMSIYVDGQLENTVVLGASVLANPASYLAIGRYGSAPTGYAQYWQGGIEEARFYNAALTTAQVQADMFSTASALPANLLYYYNFDQGTAGGTNTGVTSLTDQSGNGHTGTLNNFALSGTTSNWVRSFPTITGLSTTTGFSGSSVTITGTNLTDATSIKFNGTAVAPFTTPVGDFATTVTVPAGATTGPVSVSSATLTAYNGPTFTVTADLVINTTTTIPAGTYNTITVNSGGNGTLAGNVTVLASTTVNSGGTLNDGCFVLTGSGSFTLAAGGTLGICSAQGISAAPEATGAIQNTGTRSFDADALYTYNGTVAQATGTGLPTSVRTLTLNNAAGLTLATALTTTTATTLTSGVLTTGANALTLGNAATLSETTTGYATGTVQTTRALSTAGNPESFGGLGLTLTPSGSTLPGSTFVARTTGTARTGVGTSQSVKRTFDIQPTVNAGLNVALALTVRDDERNNIAAANLKLFRSKDSGATWQPVAGATTTATTTNGVPTYTASVSGVGDFSIWTLGDATNPLPVQLVAFTAQAREATVALAWRTASETNSARFEVERSEDGRTFALVGTVAAAGTSLVPRAYELLDGKLPAGAKLLYYRLRQVDLDGTAAYSQVQTVAMGKQGLALYPNPAGRTTTLSGAAAGAPVLVYDAVGALVLTAMADATGTAVLALPATLPAGLYLVRSGAAPALRLTVE